MPLKKYFLKGYRRRILLCITVMLFLISSSLITTYYFIQKNRDYTHLMESGFSLVNNLAYNSEAGVFAENEVFLEVPVAAVMQEPDVLWTAVYNLKGKPIKLLIGSIKRKL